MDVAMFEVKRKKEDVCVGKGMSALCLMDWHG